RPDTKRVVTLANFTLAIVGCPIGKQPCDTKEQCKDGEPAHDWQHCATER
ncbi:MAG: hypothetical protein RLZZ332_1636, partial [Actinomycetota bacterium]